MPMSNLLLRSCEFIQFKNVFPFPSFLFHITFFEKSIYSILYIFHVAFSHFCFLVITCPYPHSSIKHKCTGFCLWLFLQAIWSGTYVMGILEFPREGVHLWRISWEHTSRNRIAEVELYMYQFTRQGTIVFHSGFLFFHLLFFFFWCIPSWIARHMPMTSPKPDAVLKNLKNNFNWPI